MNSHSAPEGQNSLTSAARTPRRRDARHSPYPNPAPMHERLSASLSAPPSAAPGSPASSISSLPAVAPESREPDRQFPLSSAQWSPPSSRESSPSSDDADVSAPTSRFGTGDEEAFERRAPCRLTALHPSTSSSSSRYLPLPLPPAPQSYTAPRMIQPPPASSAPPMSYQPSHERLSPPVASFHRAVSAGALTTRQPRAPGSFTRVSAAGASLPLRRRTSCESDDDHPRVFKAQSVSASEDEADEDGDVEDDRPMSSLPAAASSSSIGSSSRLLKPLFTQDPSSLFGRIPGPSSSRPTFPKSPKASQRKKKSNAGRVDIPVEIVNGKRRYMCPHEPSCGSHFSRKNDAYRHLDDRHGAGKQDHVCGCGRKLSRRDALHRHYTTCQWTKANRKKGRSAGGGENEEEMRVDVLKEEEADGGDDEEEMGTDGEDEEDQLADDE